MVTVGLHYGDAVHYQQYHSRAINSCKDVAPAWVLTGKIQSYANSVYLFVACCNVSLAPRAGVPVVIRQVSNTPNQGGTRDNQAYVEVALGG